MRYCLRYANSSKIKNVTDEISIIYNRQFDELMNFLQEHLTQRVVLVVEQIPEFCASQEWHKLGAVVDAYPDLKLAVCLGSLHKAQAITIEMQETINHLKERNIEYFFGALIKTWDQLDYYIGLGVSDVYLVEDICFELGAASAICNRNRVRIRVFPNVAQCSIGARPALKKFFIRPEDVPIYEQYVDTFEFWGPLERQDVFYLIYHDKQRWFGDLKEIIFDLNEPLDSRRIMPLFGKVRATCGKRCLKNKHCNICDHIESLAHTLEEKNLIIKTKKSN